MVGSKFRRKRLGGTTRVVNFYNLCPTLLPLSLQAEESVIAASAGWSVTREHSLQESASYPCRDILQASSQDFGSIVPDL